MSDAPCPGCGAPAPIDRRSCAACGIAYDLVGQLVCWDDPPVRSIDVAGEYTLDPDQLARVRRMGGVVAYAATPLRVRR